MKDFDELVRGCKRETIRIGGQEFQTRAKMHPRRFTRMLNIVDGVESPEQSIDATIKFMELVLIGDDRQRFRDLVDHGANDDDDDEDDRIVTFEQLKELVEWVVEHYTGKANKQETSSTPGSPPAQTPPNVVSFNRGEHQAS